jgi:hypothetical protein
MHIAYVLTSWYNAVNSKQQTAKYYSGTETEKSGCCVEGSLTTCKTFINTFPTIVGFLPLDGIFYMEWNPIRADFDSTLVGFHSHTLDECVKFPYKLFF